MLRYLLACVCRLLDLFLLVIELLEVWSKGNWILRVSNPLAALSLFSSFCPLSLLIIRFPDDVLWL